MRRQAAGLAGRAMSAFAPRYSSGVVNFSTASTGGWRGASAMYRSGAPSQWTPGSTAAIRTPSPQMAVQLLVGATVIALAAGWVLERRVSMMALVGCVAVAFFGGLSVYFDNELFIKIKPTVLTCLLAAVIAGGRLMGMNPIGAIMGSQIRMTDEGWRALSWIWVAMFLTTALANEIAWRSLSTDDWVTFKVFGITTISLVFGAVSVPIMTKHQIED